MFAYCSNNPVMFTDPNGEFWHIVAGAVIGGLIGGISTAITTAATEGQMNWAKVGVSVAVGAATGALCAAGIPAAAVVAVSAAGGIVESVGHDLIDNCDDIDNNDHSVSEIIVNAVISGGTSAAFAYCGASAASAEGKQLNNAWKLSKKGADILSIKGAHPITKAAADAAKKAYNKAVKRFIKKTIVEDMVESSLETFVSDYIRAVC